MKKQKAHPNHLARPNYSGGYIEWHRMDRDKWILRDTINLPTNEVFDNAIKAMIANGLTKNDGLKDGKIVVYNANHSEGIVSVVMEAKKAYELFNQVI